MFKQVDADNDGIVTEDEFKQLLLGMNVLHSYSPDADLDCLLKAVDPHNHKTMTYSQVIALLSSQLISKNNNGPGLEETYEQQNVFGSPSQNWIGSEFMNPGDTEPVTGVRPSKT